MKVTVSYIRLPKTGFGDIIADETPDIKEEKSHMKKITALLMIVFLCLSLASCGGSSQKPEPDGSALPQSSDDAGEAETASGIIVSDAGKESIFVASGSAGLLSVNLADAEISIGSEKSSYQNLKNGMTVSFAYDMILETYPGMVSPKALEAADAKDGCNDICGLYMKVIGDLWNEDEGLNGNGENVYLDLSRAPGLDSSLNEALIWLTANLTGKTVLSATWDELKEQGIFDSEKLYIENGCYIGISGTEDSENAITFSAQKYVSGLGAIFFQDCSAKMDGSGEWTYTPVSFAIA